MRWRRAANASSSARASCAAKHAFSDGYEATFTEVSARSTSYVGVPGTGTGADGLASRGVGSAHGYGATYLGLTPPDVRSRRRNRDRSSVCPFVTAPMTAISNASDRMPSTRPRISSAFMVSASASVSAPARSIFGNAARLSSLRPVINDPTRLVSLTGQAPSSPMSSGSMRISAYAARERSSIDASRRSMASSVWCAVGRSAPHTVSPAMVSMSKPLRQAASTASARRSM